MAARICLNALLIVVLAASAACIFIGVGCEPAGKVNRDLFDLDPADVEFVRFISDDGTPVSLWLDPSHDESECGKVVARFPGGEPTVLTLDSLVKFFHSPCILEAGDKLHSQLVIIPYFFGGGTGVGQSEWCLVWMERGKLHLQQMGHWAYHSVSKDSMIFTLYPAFRRWNDEGNPGFHFELLTDIEGVKDYVSGRVVLRIVKGVARLDLVGVSDAEACVSLLTPYVVCADWAADRLETIIPEAIARYRKAREEGGFSGEVKPRDDEVLQEIREAVKRYYD